MHLYIKFIQFTILGLITLRYAVISLDKGPSISGISIHSPSRLLIFSLKAYQEKYTILVLNKSSVHSIADHSSWLEREVVGMTFFLLFLL